MQKKWRRQPVRILLFVVVISGVLILKQERILTGNAGIQNVQNGLLFGSIKPGSVFCGQKLLSMPLQLSVDGYELSMTSTSLSFRRNRWGK
jgi:hypothetical protein